MGNDTGSERERKNGNPIEMYGPFRFWNEMAIERRKRKKERILKKILDATCEREGGKSRNERGR